MGQFIVKDHEEKEEIEPHQFAPNEVIQMMVDFQPDEVINMYEPVGGRLYIHDSREIPGMESLNYDLYPGYYYEFYVRRTTTKQLPEPYDTKCENYIRTTNKSAFGIRPPLSRHASY